MILPDTLWPPSPAQLVADCRAMGAGGCWVYAARRASDGTDIGIGGWTAGHVAALHADGRVAPAIIVPGTAPSDVGLMLDAADALGCDPPTAFDIETFSLPTWAWLEAAIAATRARGRRPLRYGDGMVLATYPTADGDWWSHGAIPVRAGSYLPVPPLPAGLVADQYAVQVVVNGSTYDVSVADEATFGGDMTPDEHKTLMDCAAVLAKLDSRVLGDLPAAGGPGWGAVAATVLQDDVTLAAISNQNQATKAELDALKAEIEAGGSISAAAAIARIEKALQSA